MNIMLLSRYFLPEIGTNAALLYELAKELTERGHKVTVITNFPWYNLKTIPKKYQKKIFMKESMDGFKIIRIGIPLFGTKRFKLAVGHLTSPLKFFIAGCLGEKPDLIYIYSPPLFLGIAGWLLSLYYRVPFILGVQDLHPQCYVDQDILKNKILISLLEKIEMLCYKKASLITVHSPGNKEFIVSKKKIGEDKIKVLPNWINTEELKPLPKNNEFSSKYNLNNKFIVGYAGTLGMSQGLLSLIDVADIIKNNTNIEILIVGDGIEKEKMIEKAKRLNLANIRFLDMQPKDIYPYVVASLDVGLVFLNKKVKTPTVPSKILSIMSASRTVLASVPLDGDAAKLVNEAKGGICVEPENPEKLVEKINFLYENRDICQRYGEQGREYVMNNISLKKIAGDFEYISNYIISEYKNKTRGRRDNGIGL